MMTQSSRQRVVVQLVDIDAETENNINMIHMASPMTIPVGGSTTTMIRPSQDASSVTRLQPKYNFDIEALDGQTLQLSLNMITQDVAQPQLVENCSLMHFDVVGNASDPHTRAEITELMDVLLDQRQNCCLIRFNVLRELQSPFLCHLLINEVDRHMHQSHMKIHSIKMEYYDLRKYDVINMFGYEAPRSKRSSNPYIEFKNTMDLLKWLQFKHPQLLAEGGDHEYFEFQFTFADKRRRLYTTRLALLQMYMSQMDGDTKNCVRKFFEHVKGEKRAKRRTMITDCIKEFFDKEAHWRTWLIFNVPIVYGGAMIIDDMLKLADAANGRTRRNRRIQENTTPFRLNTEMSKELSESKENFARRKSSAELSLRRSRNVKKNKNLSKKDFHSLSYWYKKIDERVSGALAAMEKYYKQKYDMKVNKMCGDIKCMTCIYDHFDKKLQPLQTRVVNESESLEELREYYGVYKAAIEGFKKLSADVRHSPYMELLKVYLKTKDYELQQHTLQSKMRQLKSCQERLMDTIKYEVRTLNAMKTTKFHIPER